MIAWIFGWVQRILIFLQKMEGLYKYVYIKLLPGGRKIFISVQKNTAVIKYG
jgi:hypothetical protein